MGFWFYLRVIYCFSILIWFMGWLFIGKDNTPPIFLAVNLLIATVLMVDFSEFKEQTNFQKITKHHEDTQIHSS